jgi:DNA invertase Pin-like site-specific DNA recombinase
MSESRFAGKRYICLVRASHSTEELSTDAQLNLMNDVAQKLQMFYVDAVVVDGLTGSLPGKREDLEALLERKRIKNDFDVLVLQRVDRLTRSGLRHGFGFEWQCQCLGIELLFVGDDIPDNEYTDMVLFMKYQAAKEQAYSISQRSTQGSQFALEQGRVIPSSRTPYGCWRLYLSADGKPSHIIRDVGDGRQEKLDPKTHQVIDTYGSIGGRNRGHYRKQKTEMPRLMPGDADKVEVVRLILRLHYMEGLGGKRIANILNERGIRSPMGKGWSQPQVESIYKNEVYTGRAVGNRISMAIYHERNPNAPKKVKIDPKVYATAKKIPLRHRPFEEWKFVDQPLMREFLESVVRERAMADHERIWALRGDSNRPRRSTSKHKASDYLLSGLLYAKQDEASLVGVLCGDHDHRTRYYRHRRGRNGYRKGSIFNRMIRAEAIEQAVVALVAEQLQNLPQLRELVVQAVVEQSTLLNSSQSNLEELRQRREQLKKRTQFLVSTLDEATRADAKPVLDQLGAERIHLDEQIAAAEAAESTRTADPQKVADSVLERLKALPLDIQSMPKLALREVIATFVEKVVGDMETKDIEVILRLPTWAFSLESKDSAMRPAPNLRSQDKHETHVYLVIQLGVIECRYLLRPNNACYDCRRRSAA